MKSIVEDVAGGWGPYQYRMYASFSASFFIMGVQALSFMFTGGVPANRCRLPEVDGNMSEYHNELVMDNLAYIYAVPIIQRGKTGFCSYCPRNVLLLLQNATNNLSYTRNETCAGDHSISCDHGHIYDRSQYSTTLAASLNLICPSGSYKREIATSFYMIGYLVGASSSGTLGDMFGRRPTLLAFSICGIAVFHIQALIAGWHFVILCICMLLNGTFAHGAFVTAFVLTNEYVGGYARTVCAVWCHGWFAAGFMWVGVIAYLIRDWQMLQLVLALPSIITLVYIWTVPESIRWLTVKCRYDDAFKILKKAAAVNKRNITDSEIWSILSREQRREEKQASIFNVFRHKALAKMASIMFLTWFATAILFWGISLNTVDLPGNDYLNHIINGVIAIPAFLIALPMLSKLGRRATLCLSLGSGGTLLLLIAVIPPKYSPSWLVIILAQLGKVGASLAFSVVYIFAAELFPTVARNVGVGYSSSFSRLASISAPQIAMLGQYLQKPWLPFLIYGLVAVFAAVTAILLPESLGQPLPDTIMEGIDLAERTSIRFCGRRNKKDALTQKLEETKQLL